MLEGARALARHPPGGGAAEGADLLAAAEGVEGAVTTRLSAQYVEIYNDTVVDLLTGDRCDVRRAAGPAAGGGGLSGGGGGSNNSNLVGAVECPIGSLDEAVRLLRAGQVRKRFAATAMNERSSRAHTIFVLHVRQTRGDAMVRGAPGVRPGEGPRLCAAIVPAPCPAAPQPRRSRAAAGAPPPPFLSPPWPQCTHTHRRFGQSRCTVTCGTVTCGTARWGRRCTS